MAISDRKQRDWINREALILEHADSLLRTHGYLGLNLDHLADLVEYSKATIYNHFSTKEDLLLGVNISHLSTRERLFSRALTYDGNTRERMFVIGIADSVLSQLYPHGFPLVQLVQNPSIWEKTSPQRQKSFGNLSGSCLRIAHEVVHQARLQGDLPPPGLTDDEIVFGIVSMSKGAHLLAEGAPHGFFPGTRDPQQFWKTLSGNYHAYLDGVGWKPSEKDFDYCAAEKRIRDTIFRSESASPNN
jgi:AcrR family transcriptional regulator